MAKQPEQIMVNCSHEAEFKLDFLQDIVTLEKDIAQIEKTLGLKPKALDKIKDGGWILENLDAWGFAQERCLLALQVRATAIAKHLKDNLKL